MKGGKGGSEHHAAAASKDNQNIEITMKQEAFAAKKQEIKAETDLSADPNASTARKPLKFSNASGTL